ncbi:hypothetical protein C0Q70_04032 [Pomacea canaliculata]|uniref:ABC-type glutathione-S-conjugate transporter n=1 Tax=Pomacea canaliculata TaxID=400727 RepID=A0A2T7PUF3_POMCA|nr:hypothetical protein C0Q70_04032 [Pomacea canaliculata]
MHTLCARDFVCGRHNSKIKAVLIDLDLLLNSSWPHFTACFQSSVLVFVPNGYLWCAKYGFQSKTIPYPTAHYIARFVEGATYMEETGSDLDEVVKQHAQWLGGNKLLTLFLVFIFPSGDVGKCVNVVARLLAAALTQIERCKMPEEDIVRFSIFLLSYALTLIQLFLQAFFADVPRNWHSGSLLLSNKGQQEGGTVGEVVNLMAVDCQRVQDMMSYTWMVWSIPLQVMLAVYLLWDTLGLSVLAGVGLLVILVPVNGYLAFHQQNLQKQNLQWKDRRVKLIHEILSGIKVLKLYAWETSFEEKVLNIRRDEIKVLSKVAHLNAFSIFIWTCAPYLVTLATFATYVLSDPEARLDANKAFVTLSLFNILQFPISFIPEMISFTAQALVSIKRIEKFLKQEELDPSLVSKSSMTEKAIQIERGHFSWDSQNVHSALSSINIEISEGELVAVVGNVGSGKSSLLAAMLGEIQSLRGKVVVKGNVAYVPQQAWIQNASLKDNILFGQVFDSRRFKKVLSSCALTADISILPGGELTEIGEKGINLSGGQKQRVSLARAVYADADVYLIDDPLSAVDSHVGKHIFRNVISDKGLLKHKTRVLVTHAVHWLPLVDTVVLLQEGRIVEAGSYLQLMRRNGPLAQYLHFVLSTSDDTDAEDDPEGKFLQSQESKSLPPHSPSDAIMISPFATQLTEEEQAATGSVKITVFGSYAYHIGRLSCVVIFLLFAMYQVTNIYASFWLAEWTENPIILSSNATALNVQKTNKYYLTFYGVFGALQAVFISLYAWLAATQMVKAAGNMHAAMLDRVLRSPMSFFDTTPSGRIVNRFARDVETIDNTLPQIFFMFVMCVFSVLSTLCVISITTPLFMSVIFPLAVGYYALQRFFVPTSRQLKRLEAVTRSPIYNHFSETLSGASVIRAFGATNRFVRECLQRIDKNQVFYFAGITANRWLGVWIEMVSTSIVFASSVFVLVTPDITGGQAGLSITYALQITQALKWLVRTVSDLETNIVSVERVQEYSELKTEAPRVTSVRPRLGWPSHGNVILANYSTRYRPGLDLVLKHIDVNIRGGEKVGIVGRTGAGKSSLTLALFRLIEATTGTISIDGVDISSLGLCDLRSRITILPQDPVVFSGSLRMNLDPFGQFCDRELWDALHHAHLISFVRELPDGLEYHCGEEGRHLSVGQRQLLCLARGLLRRTKILILDEPTAAVDLETDLLIQGTIRKEFADCTTITIAHRLNTIMDYDRVLVLADGQVKEFDKPSTLLNDKDSIFYGLAHDAGLL